MGENFQVSVDSLDQAAAELSAAEASIGRQLDALERRVSEVKAGWSGAAKLAYAHAQDEWMGQYRQMKVLLAQAQRALAQASDRFRETEAKNAASWTL